MTYKRWRGPTRPVPNGARVVRLALESDEDAPTIARGLVGGLAEQLNDDVLERAVLLVSEVVTNSVLHSESEEIRVEIWPATGSVTVVVVDDGPGFVPVPPRGRITDQNGGFGLPLLDKLAEAWGCGSDTESWVWFEVLPRPTAHAAPG